MQSHEFHIGQDSLVTQIYSACNAKTIKFNSQGDFVILFPNCIIEIRDKDTNRINLDSKKSNLYDIFYEDNGDIFVADNNEFFGISEFKKYNGISWDIIYKAPKPPENEKMEEIRSITKDDQGNFWINVRRMYFIKYDGNKCTKFYGIDTLDGLKDQDIYPSLSGNDDNLVFYKGDLYYLGLNDNLCSINPITGIRKLYDKSLYKKDNGMAMYPKLRVTNGYLWLIQHIGNMASFDGNEFKIYHLDEGRISTQISANSVLSFDIDKDNSLWISGNFYDKSIDSNRFGILHYYNTDNYHFYKRDYFGFNQFTQATPLRCLPNGSTIFYLQGGKSMSRLLYWGDEDQNPISSVENQHQFNISSAFPNPTMGKTTLKFEANASLNVNNVTIDLYNYMGQLIKASIKTGCIFNSSEGKGILTIDLTGNPRGLYLLYVIVDGDKEIYSILKE